MLIVDFIVGAVVAVLTGLGVGSGGLLVIYLTLVRGAEQHQAQGINLLFFIFAAGASMLVHRKKRKINYGVLLVLMIFGMLGAVFGSMVSGVTDASVMRTCFGILLIISGAVTLIRSFCRKDGKDVGKKKNSINHKDENNGGE